MAAVLTGTPVAIAWASGTDPAPQDITIPSDCTAVYFFWAFWPGVGSVGLSTITLEGVSEDQIQQYITADSGDGTTGVAVWYSPATGANQTLDVTWDGAPNEGPGCIVAFVKDGDTTAWRDAGNDSSVNQTEAISVTLTTESDDLVIKLDVQYIGAIPSLSSGWTNGQTQNYNSEGARLSYISATGSTQVCDAEDENWSYLSAVSIPADVGGGNDSLGAGVSSLDFTAIAAARATGRIVGASSLDYTVLASLQAIGKMSGLSTLDFTTLSTIVGRGSLAGGSSLDFASIANAQARGRLTASEILAFTAAGIIGDAGGPVITSVNANVAWLDGDSGLVILGSGFLD